MKIKRLISFLLIGIIMLTSSACGKTKKVLQTKYISIDGICVDDSYKEEDNNLRRVYLFYTLNAVDKNLEADSLYTDLIFEKTNKYTSANYPKACDLAPNWYYSSYIEDVYIGEELKVIASFEIPENDLAPGRTVTLEDTQIPDAEKLCFSTDDFIHLSGFSEIAMAMDPEGYADEQNMHNPADASRIEQVQSLINGYQWSFYVNYTSYKLEFEATNNFTLKTTLGSNSGTYSVLNGYVVLTYPNGNTVEIPYDINDGKISLECTDAFDVKE